MIEVEHLSKTYRVPVKKPGLAASFTSLWSREFKDIRAVDDVSFRVEAGERVGFLGPNGAGKTTTLKMLTGLLHPTSGAVRVAGHVPQHREPAFLRQITLVMGQKQQLMWDLPASETLELNRALFDLDRRAYAETRAELVELLQLSEFIDQPVRNLSLGQRMRCELAAALLHRPRVLFLDEPTIGLDVEVQAIVRRFIAEHNARHGATIVLTSHDMNDVRALANRIVLIDQGVVRFDGSLPELERRFGAGRRLEIGEVDGDLSELGLAREGRGWKGTFEPAEVNRVLAEVLRRAPLAEVTVSGPPLDEVLTRAFGASRERPT